jgi:hypothetical protein
MKPTRQIAQEVHDRWQASPHKQAAGEFTGVTIHAALIYELQAEGHKVAPILEIGEAPESGLQLTSWVNVWADPGDDGYFDLMAAPPIFNAKNLPGRRCAKDYMIHDFEGLMKQLYESGCGPLIADLSPILDSIYSHQEVNYA